MSYRDWDERYASGEFVYGTDANSFLVEHAGLLTSPVLSLAEGEGRNAVFLAEQGLDVLGVDNSSVGLKKASALASERGVSIRTLVADLYDFRPEPHSFGSVISIWAHLPSRLRSRLYPRIEASLLPQGLILLEAYSVRQLDRNTGGPKDEDMLMTVEKVEREWANFEPLVLREIEREVCEGKFHTGLASVVQFIGRKRNKTA